MDGKMSGDKHPPDNNGEKESLPKEGEIYRWTRSTSVEPEYYMVTSVKESEAKGQRKDLVRIHKVNPDTGKKVGLRNVRFDNLPAFVNQYALVANSLEELSSKRTLRASDLEAVGAEPLPPEKDAEGNDLPIENPEELVLTPEMEAQEGVENKDRDASEEKSAEPKLKPEEAFVIPDAPQEQKELTPEQQKSLLEEQLESARRAFVEDDYKVSTKTSWLAKTLGVKTEIAREPAYKDDYETALKALHEYELAEIQRQESSLSKDDLDKKIESHLLRYGIEEAINLYTLGNEIKFESEQETWHGKAREHVARIATGYRTLSWKKKLAIAGGVAGLSALSFAGGSAVAALAGVAWTTRRVVAGVASYMATDELFEKGTNWLAKTEEGRVIRKALQNNESWSWEDVLGATEVRISDLDKLLQTQKTIGKARKVGAFAVAIGLPTFLSHTDWFTFGEGVEKPEAGAASGVPEPSDALEAKSPLDNANPSGNGGMPEGGRIKIPVTGEGAGGAAAAGEAMAEKTSGGLSAVTIEKGDNLWSLMQKQLPETLTDEAEKNRVTASLQNLVHNKLAGLTEAQIKEQYGFSSKDISRLQPGETIKLDALVTKEELDEIMKGGTILPRDADGLVSPTAEVGTPNAATVEEAAKKAMEARAAEVGPIGFQDNRVVTEGRDWDAINANQGNYEDSPRYYDHGSARYRETLYDNDSVEPEMQPTAETEASTYSYEESRLQSLNKEELKLARENMTVLQADLFDMSDTPDGPQYPLGKLSRETLWGLYENKGMQDLIATDNPRFEGRYDPRDWYAERSARGLHGRYPGVIQLPERFPQPTLSEGPDWRANYEMDKLQQYYRNNLRDMSYAAVEQWGTVALPQGSKETVKEYMSRILALYTRERIKNPEFRLNF